MHSSDTNTPPNLDNLTRQFEKSLVLRRDMHYGTVILATCMGLALPPALQNAENELAYIQAASESLNKGLVKVAGNDGMRLKFEFSQNGSEDKPLYCDVEISPDVVELIHDKFKGYGPGRNMPPQEMKSLIDTLCKGVGHRQPFKFTSPPKATRQFFDQFAQAMTTVPPERIGLHYEDRHYQGAMASPGIVRGT